MFVLRKFIDYSDDNSKKYGLELYVSCGNKIKIEDSMFDLCPGKEGALDCKSY